MTGGVVSTRRKITANRGRPSDCGSEDRKEDAGRNPPEDERAVPSTETPEMGCFDCEVFISFRGKDTRKGFTSHLHKELESRGISTFIDSQRLEKGRRVSDLFKWIEGSKIFMPIFSKNYAESKWCLGEIAKMVEINKREGDQRRPIIPIFYDVPPDDVKNFRASFEEAFESHQHNIELGEEQINEWKVALTEAGKISGYCLPETEGDEAKLITLIGARVSNILSKVRFDIQPIGIDSHMNALKQMLERGNKGVCMIGICGLGGIGKTTLAMALYNELSPTFEGSCFLSNMRENEKEGLPSLQAKFMEEVLRGKMPIGNVREGVSLMKQRLGSKKVLLILDDVEHTRQLEAFTPNRREKVDWLGAGSKIIVTTRNKEVLIQHGLQEDAIYFPKGLDGEQSLQLFFRYAFVSDYLLAELDDLPQEIVEVAAGLPLALIVFGSHFSFLKKKQEWEETLETFKSEQHKDVYEQLRISYEGLNDREKYVFLDIACFFIGESKEYPFYMWEACGWRPRLALEVLQHRSLIKINENDRFEMHDQIRDMGRMVVKEGGQFDDPLTYSRPWSKDQVLEVLKNPEDLWRNSGVQVLHLSRFYFEKVKMSRMGGGEMPKPSWKGIAAMPHLRMIIAGSEAAFDEHEKEIHLPGKIRWLSWDWCPHETVAFRDSRHEQLCILELHGGHFRGFRSPTLVLPKLKVLDLTWCGNLIRTPDFTHLPSLVKLVLHYCTSLIELDESIGHLSKLEKLIMEGCSKLKGLPAGLCKLTSLEFLDIFGCMQISVLPEQIGDLKSLKHLDLGRTGISYIPHSIGRLQCLEWLDLTGCSSLRTIPDRIGGLKNLSWLSLAECKLLEQLPNSMGTLTSLKELDIRNCESLIEVPDSLGDLNNDLKIFVEGCISLEILPNSIRMSGACFDELHLNGFKSLRRLPDSVADMRSVRWLSLRDCKSLQEIPVSIDRLESLEILDLSGCISLKKIPESIGNLKCLKCMSLKHCRSLEELPESMADLMSLEVLHISGGMSVKRVPDFIGKLKKVRELHLRGIEEMPNLISGLLRLEKLRVRDCPKLESLPRLSSSLTHLSVIGCKALPDLSGLESLKSLQELVLVHGDGLGWKLMEKISQSSFERLKHLLIAGASEGSDLLFQLPKWQLLEQPIIVRLFCLVEEPPFNSSQINVRIQVKVEGKMVTEGTWKARKAKDFDVPEKLEVEGKALYGVVLGNEEEEIFRCYVQQGRATFRVKATYKQYHLKMAYFYVKSPNLGLDYSVF